MQKLSRAESGKLGGEKSRQISALKKKERVDQYMENPNKCKNCDSILDYENRKKTFCNSSCAATYNNLKRENRAVPTKWNCVNCGKEHTTVGWRVGKYCDNFCQRAFETKERTRQWLEEKKDWGLQIPEWAKNHLAELRGYQCEVCGISEWNEKKLVLEVDHIDGIHTNNDPDNLRLICPNCHSQTDTYKAKNVGKGRGYRRS